MNLEEFINNKIIAGEKLNEQNPQAVQQAIQGYKLEVSELTKEQPSNS